MSTETTSYKVVGTRPIRHDALDKVTGRANYGADIHLPGMLHGKVLRSPHAHALIKSIDTSEAEKLPGVMATMTARDLPVLKDKLEEVGESVVNLRDASTNVLAPAKAMYHGHPVAAVCATSPHIAEEALKLIKVEYEELPAVLNALDAMQEDAPVLHEDLKTNSLGEISDKASNVSRHFQNKKGDIEKGFEEADVVVEHAFTTATIHQGYIEPHNATARWDENGGLTVWTSAQGHFAIRSQTAQILNLPESKVRVMAQEIGGGFGAKFATYLHPLAAVLSQKTGRPVKFTMSRTEEFLATGPAPGGYTRVKLGATNDGKLVAAQVMLAFEAGAFPGSAVGAGAIVCLAPYNIPNVVVDGYDVVVNKPKSQAYRAPGGTNAAVATETVIDEISEKIGMDPLDFRLKNGVKEGDTRSDGPTLPKVGYLETVETAKTHEHYTTPLEGKYRGRGVASGFWMNGGGQSSVILNVISDGTLTLIEGSVDIGGTRTTCAMQAAETLGLRAEDIKPHVADTDTIGYTDGTGGSRTTFATGLASIKAAEDVIRQMTERAAKMLEVEPEDVDYAEAVFTNKNDTSNSLTFKEVAEKTGQTGGPVIGRATVQPGGVGHGFGTHIVDVEVDIETGKVEILRYTAVQDVGKAIHPSYVEGQIAGGVAQGIGGALHEEFVYDDNGHLQNSSFLDYRMPTSLDLPMIDPVLVEVANPGHPYGVRGVGEVPIIPPPGAIANAIYHAIGVRLKQLPMSPRVVLETLGKI
ncbi:MAG: xanthine dehydrogenase family protein molybdopterin-binding subunit [Planctomycetota bacterium]|nr:xanthine dehydrogenase family protein molybdopterin-binding subunit [Planctomycetota bacterium]